MEYTVEYKVKVAGSAIIISEANVGVVLTEEQHKRVYESFCSGKYTYMDEDLNIRDVYQLAYKNAVELEKGEEYGYLVEEDVFPVDIEYPIEIKLEAAYRPWVD